MARHAHKGSHGPAELLVVEAEEFPTAVIVELWHTGAGGKREFLDSRRYDTTDEPEDAPQGSGGRGRG